MAANTARKKTTAGSRSQRARRKPPGNSDKPKVVARPPSLRGPKLMSGRSGAPEIMVALNNEHRYIASLLEALGEQADNLLPNRSPDYTMIRDIVHYMASYPDEFHHPREDLLFARLRDRDSESRDAIEFLEEGHREIKRRNKELLEELTRIINNGKAADNHALKYLCDRYIGYYWDHINTEESQVFPRATAKLRQADWFAINSEARYVDDPLFGSRVRKEYRRLSQYLNERLERVTENVAIAELFGIEAMIETAVTLVSATGDLGGIVSKRVRRSLVDTVGKSRDRLREPELGNIAGLPRAIGAAICRQMGEGREEIRELARKTRADLSEPYVVRMGYLRKLFKETLGASS